MFLSKLIRSRSLAWMAGIALGASAFALPAHADEVEIDLQRVRVDRARERGGDRPYFVTIKFRARHGARGSTSTTLYEREPHDWVGKAQYRAPVVNGHLPSGRTATLPRWMGRIHWDNVEVVRFDPADRSTHAAATRSEVLGAITIGLDNNNTPPHVIRNLLKKLEREIQKVLRQQVESGRLLGAMIRDPSSATQGLTGIGQNILSTGDKLKLFIQMTVGSTFNPDRMTGVQIVIMPALTGIRERAQTMNLSVAGMGVPAQVLVGSPRSATRTFRYTGSGASWTVTGRTIHRASRTAAQDTRMADRLRVALSTGGDDLRGGRDGATIRVWIRGRAQPIAFQVRQRLADHSTVRFDLPAGRFRPADVQQIQIETMSRGGMGGDNWDLTRLQVEAQVNGRRTVLLDRSGPPLKRFKGDDPRLTIRMTPRR